MPKRPSYPPKTRALKILSMGWGVQTWTLAAMMAVGEHERADYIVFADTHHEGQATYEFRAKWEPWLGEHGLDVVTVAAARADVTREDWGTGSVMIPAFSVSTETGKQGQIRRQCTHDWKVVPVRKWARTRLEATNRKRGPGSIEMWQGISWDESHRMRDSDVRYIANRYPLVDLRMTRAGCVAWLHIHNLLVPPKSACTFCPFSDARSWHERKALDGEDWQEAVTVDGAIRNMRLEQHGPLYVHPARKPLAEAVRIPEDEGAYQAELDFCEGGYCHV